MRFLRIFLLLPLLLQLTSDALQAQKKKRKKKGDEEEITQTLAIPNDPQQAVAVEPQRLGFLTAPLTSKGLLSQQVPDSLKAIRGMAHGAAVMKIRAFVAGSGDLSRFQ